MAALVVVLAATLCAAVAVGSPEIKQKFYSPILGSPEKGQKLYSPLLDSGRPSREPTRIVDGEPACRDQFRHHASIVGDDGWLWGGSLIKPTAILTNAHNVNKFKKFSIHLGTIFREGDVAPIKVESIWGIAHPDKSVGVILLNVEVPLGRSIWPVKLPSFDEVNETFTGRRALITGFGYTSANEDTFEEILQFAEVTVISNDLCKKFYPDDPIPDSILCAGNTKSVICNGDGGGPLVIKTGGQYKQIGIASFIGNTCGKEIPGVYNRVTSYLEWIQRAAGNLDDWGATGKLLL